MNFGFYGVMNEEEKKKDDDHGIMGYLHIDGHDDCIFVVPEW